ncbi:MAG TPA: hypothetical protein DD638_04040 [Pasteurellaceae bacterium]|nr:hypothetical protein [Pasteurellaceae bacterium]
MSLVIAKTRQLYKKVFFIEFLSILIIGLIFKFFQPEQFVSFLLGCFIALLPQICFIGYNVFLKNYGSVKDNLKEFYIAGIFKFLLTIFLFIFVFYLFEIQPAGLFTGYIITIFLNNLLPLSLNLKRQSM